MLYVPVPEPPAQQQGGALACSVVPSRRAWGFSAIALLAVAVVASACGSSGSKASSPRPTTAASAEPATQPISDAVPAGAKRLHFEVGPITVEPGQNNIAYTKGRIPQPTEDGWIVGITPNIRKADGTVPPVDVIHLHHGVWLNMSAHDATRPGLPERFFAVGEEKTRMILPMGYGYAYKASDHWLFNYMIHNLRPKPDKVWVTYDIDFIPASSAAAKGIVPVRPIWMDVQNGGIYPVFDVIRGSGHNGTYTYPTDDPNAYGPNEPKKNEWTVDRAGTLVATAGHLHPGGLHTDLYLQRATSKARLFESQAHYYEPAGAVSWDVAMTATPANWRVAVHAGDVLSTTATYDSKTASWYESMGIMVVWMADGTKGADPLTTHLDQPGALTHGHLPENNNHGGKPAPGDYVDETKLPSQVVPAGLTLPIDDFAYARGDMSEATSVPTVKEGGTLTFTNNDAPKNNGIWHTITACKAPCDLSTGVAYPLANGDINFDSGELGQAGPPTAGRITWQVPANLPAGTYTYFCRIHPFMRGAFRVTASS
jgi:plastocyanin